MKNALAEEKKKTKKNEKKKTYRRKVDKSKITKVSSGNFVTFFVIGISIYFLQI